MDQSLPTHADVRAARERISGGIVRTPLLATTIAGRPVWLKAEVLQRTGSFKLRGALNFVGSLEVAARQKGVVAYSSGNHAQGVAAAAASHGIPATIVMPSDAPAIKLANTRRLGADVVEYDRATEDRVEIARALATERGAALIPPFDHAWTIAGQGTLGLEVLEDLAAAGVERSTLVVPASGGGLTAGIALAADGPGPRLDIMTAEPAGFDDHARSFVAADRITVTPQMTSICDALLQPVPGEITFEINRSRVAGGVVANDDEVLAAMQFALTRLKLVVEPGGAVGLAALLAGRIPGSGHVTVVLSGGNVDPVILGRALEADAFEG